MVTAAAGSAIVAHGALWHGAAPNLFFRPRIAFLVQYVPRFVRPGNRYPSQVIDGFISRKKLDLARAQRLRQLFDVDSSSLRSSASVEITTSAGRKLEVSFDAERARSSPSLVERRTLQMLASTEVASAGAGVSENL